MSFTDEVWQANRNLLTAIHEHPFVAGLGEGSLPRQVFDGYLTQDALYLADYARAMGMLAARATDPDDITFWGVGVQGAIVTERQLHAAHVEVGAGTMSPSCRAYTSYLLATASTDAYEVGVAAILPCFWIYQDVGDALLGAAGDLEGHPYGDWIGMYADPLFAEQTRRARAVTDRLAEQCGPTTRARMADAFTQAARYEWMFWDAAWRRERWPI